ncbi:hypothetical protein I307_01757 [Cryptococcus deuterogattii 99/473]|uniref:Uncharacterized protein n=1 Tax=Cryptococcus deuterogattii Ram5 TaxID=1296110 RepID=A0A0D0T0C3_9TREE|nr:hypothetical protein I313_05191 [Cryptococcus deuterogattii Ram5]KIY58955.1 hypothetical protein I307_01757 [Cryptococcus deuterogattii 99/473]
MPSPSNGWKPSTSPVGERFTTSRTPEQSTGSSSVPSPSSSTFPRPKKLRSRTSTLTNIYTPPLPPVMSRENSAEDVREEYGQGPSRLPPGTLLPSVNGRRASKSVSYVPPNVVVTPSKYYTPQTHNQFPFVGSPNSNIRNGVMGSPEGDMKNMLKRRTSTPSLVKRVTRSEEEEEDEGLRGKLIPKKEPQQSQLLQEPQKSEVRARSTSTSVVVPQTQGLTEHSTYTSQPIRPPMPPSSYTQQPHPPRPWSAAPPSPSSPVEEASNERSSGFLSSAYNYTESGIVQLFNYVRPSSYHSYARQDPSDVDSEKGLNGSEDETEESSVSYFTLPPTPPEQSEFSSYAAALPSDSLPTPTLSARSLSRNESKRGKLRRAFRRRSGLEGDNGNGLLSAVWSKIMGSGGGNGKLSEVLRDLGWIVGVLAMTFLVTFGIAIWLVQGMPITTLKHLPQSTTDVQLLSAEIRGYMASSSYGWWHTVGVLTFVGCWKHAWSVPGAVVLNILVGSLLEPMPALGLLTIITACGSLGAYLLSRPLAPLIAVLFPKPLALVRAALAPESIPAPDSVEPILGETITPIQASSDPSTRAIGGPTEASTIWRRLLVMRSMGFVPWSGMNVACGVVGVDWKVFLLTTAAGSASWNYVTASVGNILSRLKVPNSAISAAPGEMTGESLTSLLRDPVLITKLVFLSGLTLLPVILKRRSPASPSTTPRSASSFELSELPTPSSASSFRPLNPKINTLRLSGIDNQPMSPLSQSLAKFTPTPRIFDLLSFGRIAMRQGGKIVVGGVRSVVGGVRGAVRGVTQQ